MRKFLLVSCFVFAAGFVMAQYPDVPNGSFETWNASGEEEPISWNSNKTGGGNASLGPQTCYKETSNPYDGSFCVRIETKTYLYVTIVNGSCTTGKIEAPTTSKADGYVHTIKNDPLYGSAFNGRPDSIIGYYRYNSVSSDYGKIGVFLHVGNYYDPEAATSYHPDSSINKIASGTFFTPTSSVANWKKFSIPLTYLDSRTPQYILISMTSSGNQTGGSSGSKLWVDGMKAFYNPVLTTGTISPSTYIVDAGNGTSISVPFTLTGTMNAGNIVTAQLSNASGSFASPVTLGTLSTTTSGFISGTIPAGTMTGGGYRVRVFSSNYPLVAADNGSDMVITDVTGIDDFAVGSYNIYFSDNNLVVELQSSKATHPQLQLYNVSGQFVAAYEPDSNTKNSFILNIPAGLYIYRLSNGERTITGKVIKF